jgi:hypothetical protein
MEATDVMPSDSPFSQRETLLTTSDIRTPTALGSAITGGAIAGWLAGPLGALVGTLVGGLIGALANHWSERRFPQSRTFTQ